MSKVILVNPANATVGYSVITPGGSLSSPAPRPRNLQVIRLLSTSRLRGSMPARLVLVISSVSGSTRAIAGRAIA